MYVVLCFYVFLSLNMSVMTLAGEYNKFYEVSLYHFVLLSKICG